jgi:hypothetical protein
MANNTKQQIQYNPSGNPETANSASVLIPVQLGRYLTVKQPSSSSQVDNNDANGTDKEYRYIRVDSGMTLAPSRGLVAFWLNKQKGVVTTDLSRAGGAGRIAGVFPNSITPGNYGYVQTGGLGLVLFKSTGRTADPTAAGLFVVADTVQTAKADCLAAGTAPSRPFLGWSAGPIQGDNFALVNLNVPENV